MAESKANAVVSPKTIGECLDKNGGFTTGFDYLRIGLAIAVVLWHSLETSYNDGTSVRVWHAARGVISFILPSFFALSGFLVCGSLVRNKSIWVFLTNRAVRIVPALSVEILLSALILGPALSTLDPHAYFIDKRFWSYFFNIIGYIHYTLPGVFEHNPNPSIVNKSLWTIPYELECYLALLLLSYLGIVRRRSLLVALTLFACIGMSVFVNMTHAPILNSIGPPGRLLVISFIAGILLYLYRDKVPLSPGLFLLSLALSGLCLSFAKLMFLSPIPVAYSTVWVGLRMPRRVPVLMDGDYSYGLYLFAYPIQQTYSAIFASNRHWFVNAPVTVLFGLLYAAFSWHFIEKRVLSRRKQIVFLVEQVVSLPHRYLAKAVRPPSI